MAEIKDSRLMGIGNVVNTENIKPEMIQELDNISGSIVAPSEYSGYKNKLWDNSSVSSGTSEESSSIKKTKNTPVISSEESGSGSGSYDSDDSDDSDQSTSDSSEIIFNQPFEPKGIVNLDNKVVVKRENEKNHTKLLAEIFDLKEKLKNMKIPVPHFNEKKIKKDFKCAVEVKDTLESIDSNNKTAEVITNTLSFVLKGLCKYFNGRHEIFGYRLDMRGYNISVMSDLKDCRKDTVVLAGNINKFFGKKTAKLFLLFKIFILNACVTLVHNNNDVSTEERFIDSDVEDSDDEEEEEEEEEEDEESE
jgi:hypothetical protein